MKRRLSLNGESLAELTPGDLAAVQGGAVPTQRPCWIGDLVTTEWSAACEWTFNTCECW